MAPKPLPGELISAIIEHVIPPYTIPIYTSQEMVFIPQIPDLSSCTLISKSWYTQALPYRFGRAILRVGHETDRKKFDYGAAEKRIVDFLDLLKHRPHISGYIRELHVGFIGSEYVYATCAKCDSEEHNTFCGGDICATPVDVLRARRLEAFRTAFEGIGELLPLFFNTLTNVKDLHLRIIRWSDAWKEVSPNLRRAIERLFALPTLTTLRGCENLPFHTWAHNTNLTTIHINKYNCPDDEAPTVSTRPQGQVELYAPLESIHVNEAYWGPYRNDPEETLLKAVISKHPILLRNLRHLRLSASDIDTMGRRVQIYLDSTAKTLECVDIRMDFATDIDSMTIPLDFTRIANIRGITLSYEGLEFRDGVGRNAYFATLATLLPTNHPHIETITLNFIGSCPNTPHYGYASSSSTNLTPAVNDLLALDTILARFVEEQESALHTINIKIQSDCFGEPE